MEIYGLKNCDTCRKVLRTLDGAHVRYSFHDMREETPTKMQIGRWAKAVGTDRLLNTRSTTWRNLPADEKENITEKKAIELMAKHPTLIKRPVIENGPTQVFAGWTKDVEEAVLK